MSYPAKRPGCRCGYWGAAVAPALLSPAATGCGSRPTTTSAPAQSSTQWRVTGRYFCPSAELDRPYVSVSADAVVARSQKAARELATGYALWVRSIRSGEGAIEFPTPEQASAHVWGPQDRALVEDRVETQFVGTPGQVADLLEQLREATGADELIVTTITHQHADRVRSYELLAEEWRDR